MKVYEDYSQSPDGWNITYTMELKDDGQFQYGEMWTDYTSASIGLAVEGSWRRDGDAIIFNALRVEGDVGGWVQGRERKAVERGDTLDFGGGLKLSVPPPREQDVPVRNTGMKPLFVVLEPWGTRHEVAPGERVRIVARGPGGMGGLEINRGDDEVVVYGWSGSRVAVVREPKKTTASAPTRPSDVGTAKPDVMPPIAQLDAAHVAGQEFARFEPLMPSTHLAACIRRWVDELPTEGLQNWVGRLCKQNGSIPLHCTQIYLWALRPDGQVLSIDHDSFARRAELENDAVTAYAALAQGARTHPELSELLPQGLAGLRECEVCEGRGWTQAQPPAQGTDSCHRCGGMGWYAPRSGSKT